MPRLFIPCFCFCLPSLSSFHIPEENGVRDESEAAGDRVAARCVEEIHAGADWPTSYALVLLLIAHDLPPPPLTLSPSPAPSGSPLRLGTHRPASPEKNNKQSVSPLRSQINIAFCRRGRWSVYPLFHVSGSMLLCLPPLPPPSSPQIILRLS